MCGWCGALSGSWACPNCGAQRFRAVAVGVERTAEEFGRAFQGERIIWSSAEQMKRSVGPEPAVVIATAGAEPVADGGYAAVVILDARGSMMRQSLRTLEECAHRWFSAAMLARPRAHVIVTADTGAPPVQALVRWDASWLAARELADRESAGMPPATRAAILRGATGDIEEVGRALTTPHRLLGPVGGRAIVTVRREDGPALGRELRGISAVRSARSGSGSPVTITLDPRDLDA
jgi:primosomal protein N' (replication factor Y)